MGGVDSITGLNPLVLTLKFPNSIRYFKKACDYSSSLGNGKSVLLTRFQIFRAEQYLVKNIFNLDILCTVLLRRMKASRVGIVSFIHPFVAHIPVS